VRLGILGGTFDPIHLGHLLVAEEARETLACDRVLIVPAARPPHKPDRVLSPYAQRLRMVELAVEGLDGLCASDLERDARHPSFTVETLRRLRAEAAEAELWLILGADSLEDIPNWREPEEIGRLARLAVYPRPGWGADLAELADRVPLTRRWQAEGRIRLLAGPPIDLSASAIRARAADGRSLRFLVTDAVRRFICEHDLYRGAAGAHPAPGGSAEHGG
jgi:nicotinate-nucleotide adenylyltransferase